MRKALAFTLFLVSSLWADDSLVRTSEALTPDQELAALTVPDGFEIQLFASEPMINKPINLALDHDGRLWVSSTVEYPYAAKKDRWSDPQGTRVRDSRDAIKILEDTDGDGRADKVTDFADGLNIPTGVLPWHKSEHKSGCIAWSIPNIWYFADTTGDGRADHREVLFGPLGYEKDTHGMCSSFTWGNHDGWVYATHGFNNTSVLKGKDGSEVELHSGNVFRFKPDGSRVEVFTRGQVNPFGLTFDYNRNLYSADCHSSPVYQLLHGGVYPSFGKPHDGLGFAPKMIEHAHGSTGICGIAYIDRDRWGTKWNDHILLGNPVTSRINLDKIEFRGTTPVAVEKADFVTSKDPWFRPVDLCLAEDGALYVADFYNRIIGHYEVPLDHPGRDRERGRIWKITKKEVPESQSRSLFSPIPKVDIADLGHENRHRRRAAAYRYQRFPQPESIDPLLKALTETPKEDTHQIYVLRMAIRNHLEKYPEGLHNDSLTPSYQTELLRIAPAVHHSSAAALLSASPEREKHLPHITRYADDKTIAKLIAELRGKADPKTQLARIDAIQTGLDERGRLDPEPNLLAWAQQLATDLLEQKTDTKPADWVAQPHRDDPKSLPPWTRQQRKCADGEEAQFISSLRIGEGEVEQRTGMLVSKPFPAPAQLTFWIVGHRGQPDKDPHDKNQVLLIDAAGEVLHRAAPPRSDIAQQVTWKIEHPGSPVRLLVIDGDQGSAYAWLGIARIGGTDAIDTDTFRRSDDDELLGRLADFLKLTAPVALRDRLKPYLPESPAPPGPRDPKLDATIEQHIASFQKAKAAKSFTLERGAMVFKTHCATCHQLGGKGGLIGPQLDGIGARGIERLAQDILDPNRNVDSHFYLTNFKLADGTELSAFILNERGQALHVRDLAGKTRRLKLTDISARETITKSLMPTGFSQTIGSPAFEDLLAWLIGED